MIKRIKQRFIQLQPKNRLQLFFIFTLVFVISSVIAFGAFFLMKVTFIRNYDDGFLQHYETLIQLKHVVSQFLSGDGFSFWSWNIGLGADSIGSLAMVYFDPFNYIAILFPEELISVGYTFTAFLQLYAIGLGFLYFGKVTKLSLHHTLWGAIACSLSSWAILSATRHSYFLTVMFLFILIMAGVEKILRDQSPVVLIVSAALSAITFLYFAYMTAIIVFLYLLVHFIMKEEKTFASYIHYWGRFVFYVIIAACLAAVIALPVVYILMNAVTDGASDHSLFHAFSSYVNYFSSLIGGQQIFEHYSTISAGALFVLMIPCIFQRIRARKATPAMILFLICGIFLLFPFFNSVFNGFSYPIGRWCYAPTFFYIWSGIQCMAEESFDITSYRKGIIGMLAFFEIVLIFVGRIFLVSSSETAVIISLINLFFCYLFFQLFSNREIQKKLQSAYITLALLCNLAFVGFVQYFPGVSPELESFARPTEIHDKLEYATQNAGTEIKDNSFYRIDQIDHITSNDVRDTEFKNISNRMIHTLANETLVFQTPSIYSYLSTIPNDLFRFNKMVGNNASYYRRVCTYNNDNRTRLDFLMGVKYFLGNNPYNDPPTGANSYASYGFSSYKKTNKGVRILKNKYHMGLGCTFDSYITESEWLSLDYPDREQALMQCIVLPDNTNTDLIHMDYQSISSGCKKAAYHISDSANIYSGKKLLSEAEKTMDKPGQFDVDYSDSFSFHLDEDLPDCEIYLVVRNLHRDPESTIKMRHYNEATSALDRIRFRLKTDENFSDYGAFSIQASMGGITKKAMNTIGSIQGFSDIDDYMINLGRFNKKSKEIRLFLDTVGTYSYDSFELLAVPLSTYESSANICINNSLKNVKLTNNNIKGNVSTTADSSILYLSIPYNNGWQAWVDGKRVDTLQVDTAFTGIPVTSAGEHKIELHFRPVGFKIGVFSFGVGIILLMLTCIWHIRTSKKKTA